MVHKITFPFGPAPVAVLIPSPERTVHHPSPLVQLVFAQPVFDTLFDVELELHFLRAFRAALFLFRFFSRRRLIGGFVKPVLVLGSDSPV